MPALSRRFPALLLVALVAIVFALPGKVNAQGDEAPPPASGDPGDAIVTAVFNDNRIEQVLTVIGNQAGVSITPFGKVTGSRVSVLAPEERLERVLTMIAQPQGWVWFKQDDGTYGIADDAWYKANILPTKVITKIFRPDHVQASELEAAIRPMLTQGISSVTADDRTNKLIVTDLPEVIERIERLIREIDVQLFTRVFYIRFADVADIAQKIESHKSDPGTIEVDEKSHQIIVTDLLSNIKKMELLIDILDVGPDIVIYDVHNIGIDGDDLQEIEQIIEEIRTQGLLFKINEKQGVFILEDVPEVHERVEQILDGFDRPVKQVLIQGEILTTNFRREFSFGLNRFIYSSGGLAGPADGVSLDGGFQTLGAGYPFLDLAGKSITGAELTTNAYFEWQAAFEDSNTRVLLQPRLLVKNREESRIFVGREEPFLTTFFNDSVSNANITRSTSQQTVTDGLTFQIRPSISNSYLVEMEISIDNDNAEVVQRTANNQTTDLIARNRQSIDTVLTIPSGETRAIGGLITTTTSNSNAGIPFLAKIPVLGSLFGLRSNNEERFNLQLFITPTVVEDVIPRPTGADGRRGRLVTNYERVPGAFDVNADAQFREDFEMFEPDTPGQGLLDPTADTDEARAAIEGLLRESDNPRVLLEEDRTDNFIRRPQGGDSPPMGQGSGNRQRSGQQQQSGGGETPPPPPPPAGDAETETTY